MRKGTSQNMVIDEDFGYEMKALVVTMPEKERKLNQVLQQYNSRIEMISTPDLTIVQSILKTLTPDVILLDLDLANIEQMEFLIRRYAFNSCLLGFSAHPDKKTGLMQRLKLETILYIPEYYSDIFSTQHLFDAKGFLSFL